MVTIQKNPIVEEFKQLAPDSLEAWLENPPQGTEWVDNQLVEKTGVTLLHGKIQSKLSTLWTVYQSRQELGGQVYTEPPCRTVGSQGRKPDVAYLTPDLLAKHGDDSFLPQSFPLSAEVISPSDKALEIFDKANEYLSTGGQEVWLIFPGSALVIVMTVGKRCIFGAGEIAKTQVVLPGFEVVVDELLA